MMKFLFSFCLLILVQFCSSQSIELVELNGERFYKSLLDSLNPEFKYPDGRYKVFITDSSKIPTYVFNINNAAVDGPFLELKVNHWIYGNYENDILWTFLTNPEDTTFKVGTWRAVYALYSGYSGKYDNYSVFDNIYKMPFDSSGFYKEAWFFHNGKKAREATHRKGFGLEKEMYWDYETNVISKQTLNSGTNNYRQSIVYENDSISLVTLNQNGIEVYLDFNSKSNFSTKVPVVDIDVYSDNWNRKDIPLASFSIDSSKSLINVSDLKRQIFINEVDNGDIIVRYRNKRGKMKSKKLN